MDQEFQQGSAQAPEDFEKGVAGQIAEMTGPNGPLPGANADGGANAMADGLMTALASAVSPAGKIASLFVAFGDGLGGKDNNTGLSAQKPSPASRFLGAIQSHMPRPVLPLDPLEAARRAAKFGASRAAGISIFAAERLALAAQSVTGGGTADGKSTPIKGLKVTEAAAQKLTQLKKGLDAARRAQQGVNRYDGEGSAKRLPADLEKGSQLAKNAARVNQNLRPRTPAGAAAS